MPNVFCVLLVCAHTLRLGDTDDKTKGLQSQVTTKARCKIHRWIHIQSNVNVLIKYINVIPNFTVPDLLLRSPSDQDNLHPLFLLSSLLSHLYWIIRVLFPIPIQSPTSDHSGPNPHQMLTRQSNTVPKTSSTPQSPLLKSSVALNTPVIICNFLRSIGNILCWFPCTFMHWIAFPYN